MDDIYEYIYNLACNLIEDNQTMYAGNLAGKLNKKFGTSYKNGGRGIYTVIKNAYWYVHSEYGKSKADNIKFAFVDEDDFPAWRD